MEHDPAGRPYRPWAAIWVSLRNGCMHMKMQPELGGHDPDLALGGVDYRVVMEAVELPSVQP